jgi:hypothetical protein
MRYLLSDYALAGIQLPGALPSPGGSWTGVHRKELGHGRRDAEMTVSLQAKTTTFKYTSTSAYKGRRCAIIKCQAALTGSFRSGKNDIPGTYYFDVAEGRLVGVEVHAQDLGGEQGKTDYSAVLANVTAAP